MRSRIIYTICHYHCLSANLNESLSFPQWQLLPFLGYHRRLFISADRGNHGFGRSLKAGGLQLELPILKMNQQMYDRFLVVEMGRIAKRINPDYPLDPEFDYKHLFKIAEFIYKQMQLSRGPENNAYEILPVWEQLYTVVRNDPFYKDKALSTIANHIQEFFQKALVNGKKFNNAKLRDKVAARFNSKR